MARGFHLRICRSIATTMQSCRSKDASNPPQDPDPSLSRFPHVKPHPAARGSLENVKSSDQETTVPSHPEQFMWVNEQKWHVLYNVGPAPTPRRKIYNSSAFCGRSEYPRRPGTGKNKRPAKVHNNLHANSSSGDIDNSSSIILSTDDSSSELNFDSHLNPIRKMQSLSGNLPRDRGKKTSKRRGSRNPTAAEDDVTARLSMFKKLIPCAVDGKVKESLAIVKRSENPYEDFKDSMTDMVVEKQMFEVEDLEQLLQCFLSLNSRHYHGIILRVFCEICEAIFSAKGFSKV